MKICNQCQKELSLDLFYFVSPTKHKHSRCINCFKEYSKQRHRKNIVTCKEINKNNRLKRKYGITTKEYDTMVANQGSRCAICNELSKLVVDHSHKTNKIRGLLCNQCNRALGMFKDESYVLDRAVDYLRNN